MKVSIALHIGEPDPNGNQRGSEAAYMNYNRGHADLVVDPETGAGFCQFNLTFPESGENFHANYFSIGVCVAPPDLGGSIIVWGPITGGLTGTIGSAPTLDAAGGVDAERMKMLDLVVFENGVWREKTEAELRVTYPKAA